MVSITQVLSPVFELLVSVRLGLFMDLSGVLPATLFANPRGLGTCDVRLCVLNSFQVRWRVGWKPGLG